MGFDRERFWMRHSVFVRSAREAIHQALFFLGILESTTENPYKMAVEQYWTAAMHQVKGLVRGVYVPTVYHEAEKATVAPGEKNDTLNIKAAVDFAKYWRELAENLRDEKARQTYPLDKIPKLREKLGEFLEESTTSDDVRAFLEHSLPDLFRWLYKHLALILGFVTILGVSTQVEAVNGLLRNEGWRVWLYIVLIIIPFLGYWWWQRRFRKANPGQVHPWNLASDFFWRVKPLAVGPGRLIQRWPAKSKILSVICRGQFTRMLLYLAGSLTLVTVVYWLLVGFGQDSAPTVFVILWMFYFILIVANQIDYWDFLFSSRFRFILLVIAVVSLVGLRLGFGRETFVVLFVLGAFGLGFYWYSFARERRAFLLIAVFLAGLAIFNIVADISHGKDVWLPIGETAKFERLTAQDWPYPGDDPVVLMAASGGGSRAAVYTALILKRLNGDKELREIAKNLQAISSVSGGSLANAAYVTRLLHSNEKDQFGGREWDARKAAVSDLSEAVSKDFLLPTLIGALTPGMTRGKAIENAWREVPVALGDESLASLTQHWRADRKEGLTIAPFPIPLFNTATLDGHNLVISPLSKELYILTARHNEAQSDQNRYAPGVINPDPESDPYTWVYYRDGIYGLEDILPHQDLPLTSAVRASANFPFGFPVVRVQPAAGANPLFFSPRPRTEYVKLTDGGALSNSGLWPVFHLLRNLRGGLADRGVLLIIVEASKMPEYRSLQNTVGGLLGTIDDQTAIGRNLHERMLDVLEILYGSRLAVIQFDLIPRESYNVMTTWALDKASLDLLKTSFEHSWKERKNQLRTVWQALKSGSQTEEWMIDRRRPPMD